MIGFRNVTVAMALGLALAAAATPALARQHSQHPGYAARAQVPSAELGDVTMTPERANALRECYTMASKFDQKTWGVMQGQEARACMSEHGQME